MREEKNRSLLIWVIVALALLNISTLGTILYQRYSFNRSLKAETVRNATANPNYGTFSGNYFGESLNLTPEQLSEFRRFDPRFREKVMEINFSLSELRNEMLGEMTKSKVDTGKLDELSEMIGALHSDLKKLTYNYYLDFRSICDPQQQQLLEALFAETLMYDRNPGNRGGRNRMRYRGGMHRGWNR
jgi:Spy/CpxP family protein refolding chaperone